MSSKFQSNKSKYASAHTSWGDISWLESYSNWCWWWFTFSCSHFQRVKCRIVDKQSSGLNLELLPSGHAAFLPTMHLSDHVWHCEALWEVLSPGETLNDTVYLGTAGSMVVSFLENIASCFNHNCTVDPHLNTTTKKPPWHSDCLLDTITEKLATRHIYCF